MSELCVLATNASAPDPNISSVKDGSLNIILPGQEYHSNVERFQEDHPTGKL